MDATLHRLQGEHFLALMASLRGPRLEPYPPPQTEQDRIDEARVAATRRALNAYRPLDWDAAHP